MIHVFPRNANCRLYVEANPTRPCMCGRASVRSWIVYSIKDRFAVRAREQNRLWARPKRCLPCCAREDKSRSRKKTSVGFENPLDAEKQLQVQWRPREKRKRDADALLLMLSICIHNKPLTIISRSAPFGKSRTAACTTRPWSRRSCSA